MKYKIEQLEGEVKISFSLSNDEWEQELDKSYLKNKTKYSIPGFRKGKATRKMIEKAYGVGVFFDDAFNSAFYESYSKMLDEHQEIFPVDEPKVDIEDISDKGIKFVANVTVKPEVTLGDYKGLTVKKADADLTADEVEKEIDRIVEQSARKISVTDRAVKDGDITRIDYSGSVDGVKFDGGTAENQELVIGSHSFIPGFEEQMIGMTVGETKDLNVQFPKEYHAKELAGKDAVFSVTLHEIMEKQLPNKDDAFAKDVSKFETYDEYKADVEKNMREHKKAQADAQDESAILEAVTANASVEIPQCMIDRQVDYIVQDFSYRLMYMYQGMKLEDYLKYTGSDMDTFKASKQEDAKRDVKMRLTVEAIIDKEGIKVTDEDVDGELTKIAENAKKTLEEYKKTVQPKQLDYIKNDVLMKKLVAFLKENNTFDPNFEPVAEKKVKVEKKTK